MKFFDAHLHIIDPKYPLQENNGYLPPTFSVSDYLQRVEILPVELAGGAVVSGSFQGFDQSYLKAALQSLGENFVGVTQIQSSISDQELNHLHSIGIRAVRFNIKRGGSESPKHLSELSARVFDLNGWHTELYIDADQLPSLELPPSEFSLYSVDHLGLSARGLKNLYLAAEKGAKIKATGFGRLDFDPIPVIKNLLAVNPAAVMFGTDLPSTRAPRPFNERDIHRCLEAFDTALCQRLFYANALALYRR